MKLMIAIALALVTVMPLAVGRVLATSVTPVTHARAILSALALPNKAGLITGTVASDSGIYIQVEPAAITMGPAPAVNQTFVVDVKLYNATTDNVPAGVAGIEVHLHWNNTLIQPVSFQNELGTPGGVLATGLVLYALSGFYDDALNIINGPDYSQATQYAVAAASTVGGWWGNGIVVEITFKVIFQPVASAASCGLDLTYTELVDWNVEEIAHSRFSGTYTILPTQGPVKTVVDFDVAPKMLNLQSNGRWITGFIELPRSYNAANINVSTIRLNATIPAQLKPTAIGDHDRDGIPDLMIKFDRTKVEQYILSSASVTGKFTSTTLTIDGLLYDGTPFQGSCTIKTTK